MDALARSFADALKVPPWAAIARPAQLPPPVAWCDELAAWDRLGDAWDNLLFGLRIGPDPRCVISTTPRPLPLIRGLIARNGQDVVVTRMTTFENLANLAPGFAQDIVARYAGTRIGRQELYAEVLEDVEGALWTHELIEAARLQDTDTVPDLSRIVVGVDPALSATEGSAETGIVVVGVTRTEYGEPARYYVLADASLRGSPREWAEAVVEAYRTYNADRIVAEANAAGDMVEAVIRTVDPIVPIELVHASRGKYTRAEPVAALYEQGLVRHAGAFSELEDQMATFVPGEASPDRLDALVHAITALMEAPPMPVAVRVLFRPTPFW